MPGPNEYPQWTDFTNGVYNVTLYNCGDTANYNNSLSFYAAAVAANGGSNSPLVFHDVTGDCFVYTGTSQTLTSYGCVQWGSATPSCTIPTDTDYYGWRIIDEGLPCNTSVQTETFTDTSSGGTVSAERQGSYDFWVAMGSPNQNDILQYTSTINGITADRCWIMEFIGPVIPNGGITYNEPLPGTPPTNLGDSATNCDVCITNLFENHSFHWWEDCDSGTQRFFFHPLNFNTPFTNNDDVYNWMAAPHGGSLSIGDVTLWTGAGSSPACYKYMGTGTIATLGYQYGGTVYSAWGFNDTGTDAFEDYGSCNACLNPSTEDAYYHNWKRYTGCSAGGVVEKSVTTIITGSTAQERQGSHDFWVSMGEPNVGDFIPHTNPGTDPECWEYRGYDVTGIAASAGITYNIPVSNPVKTAIDHHPDCTTCQNTYTATTTYHLYSWCSDPSTIYIGLQNTTTIAEPANTAVDDGLGNPDPGECFEWGLFGMEECMKYEGEGLAALANGGAMNFTNATIQYPDPSTFSADCAACSAIPPGTYYEWKKCGGAETINIVDTGASNDSAGNIAFYTAVNTPNPGQVVNLNTNGTRADECYEYMGTNTVALGNMEMHDMSLPNSISPNCAECLVPPVPGCTDPIATNYDPAATVDDGSCTYLGGCTDPTAVNYDPNATTDDGSCTYCTYGCTDPTASNYDPAATCDDSSCIVVSGGTGCTIAFAADEECQPDGTANLTVDLSEAAGLKNVTTTIDGSPFGTPSGCTAPGTIPITGLTEGQVIDVTGECSYTKEDYDSQAGGASAPGWAFPDCGESVQAISNETKVYVFYDGTSMGKDKAKESYKGVMDWLIGLSDFTVDTVHGSATQNVFHTAVAGERWLDYAIVPLTGGFMNRQSDKTQNYKWVGGGANNNVIQTVTTKNCHAGSQCYKTHNDTTHLYEDRPYGMPKEGSRMLDICNWAHNTSVYQGITVDPFYDTAEGSLIGQPLSSWVQGGKTFGTQNNNQIYLGPPPAAGANDVLVICFLDEAASVYHRVASTSTFSIGANSIGHASGDVAWTGVDVEQPTLSWKDDYDEYKVRYNAHVGTGKTYKAFMYPATDSCNSSSKNLPMQALAGIHSGNNTTPDGMWQAGTSPACQCHSNTIGADLDPIETLNPYWDGLTPTYGGLDNFGWGVNVDMGNFTAATFVNDLTLFLGSGGSQNICDGSQCIKIKAVDESGVAISNYPIVINGVSAGSTDAGGIVTHTVQSAGAIVINDCFTFSAVGSCFQTLITIEISEAQYITTLNCILGCTDPTSWNYNPLAGIDDGSCMHPLTEEPVLSISEICKIDTECDFATDIYNIYKHDRFGFEKGCLHNIDSHIAKKYSTDWTGNLRPDYGAETFTKKLHTKGATPTPDWVVAACGEASKDLTLYFMYDTTSLSQQKVTLARNAVEEWVDEVRASRATASLSNGDEEACQNSNDAGTVTVYHTLVAGERWLDWGIFPMTGRFNNLGQYDNSGDSDFRYCGGYDSPSGQHLSGDGLIDAVVPDSVSSCHFWSTLIYDTPTRLWYNADGTNYTCGNCTGNNTAAGYNGQFFNGTLNGEPPIPTTDNVLVVAFEDEAGVGVSSGNPARNYHHNQNTYTPTWRYSMDGSTGNSAANGVDTATGNRCATCYMNDYNKFIETYLSWTGVSTERKIDFFLYPSAPTTVGTVHAHFPLHALGAIHSGDTSPTLDGQLATTPTNALGTLSAITTANPYYTAQNTVTNHINNGRLNSGYGGLDQYGWGTNVAEAAFTKAGFVTDLGDFWSTEACNDAECILIRVENKEGTPIPNYEINLDGMNIGETNEFGIIRTCVENASINTDHKINLCHCFYTTGGCNQQKIKLVVDGADCCGENIKMF